MLLFWLSIIGRNERKAKNLKSEPRIYKSWLAFPTFTGSHPAPHFDRAACFVTLILHGVYLQLLQDCKVPIMFQPLLFNYQGIRGLFFLF